jgi:hypothetical protein
MDTPLPINQLFGGGFTMFARRITYFRLLLLVAVFVLAITSTAPAFAKTYVLEQGDIELGRQGVFVANPGPGLAASLELVKERATLRPKDVSIRTLGIDMTYVTAQGRPTQPMGMVYVYFNLTSQERAAYDRNSSSGFSIWMWAPNAKGVMEWTECERTLYVERGSNGRLACLAVKNAQYFLGSTVFTFETPLARNN